MSHRSVRWKREYVVRLAVAAALAVVGSACSDDGGVDPPSDAGGSADAGMAPRDAGGRDAGAPHDAGSAVDAQAPAPDGGPVDSGAPATDSGSGSGSTDAGAIADAGALDAGMGDAAMGDAGTPDGGPTTPWIGVTSSVVGADDSIVVSFGNGPGNALDWIGMYRYSTSSNAFEVPGSSSVTSVTYEYVGGATSGSVTLDPSSSLAPGVYFIAFFEDDGFTELAPRVLVYVGAVPTLSGPSAAYDAARDAYVFPSGGDVTVSWSGAAPLHNDWLGIYDAGDTPGPDPSDAYHYVAGQAAGSATFSGLADGEYFVTYLVHDYSYFEPAPRVRVIVE